MLTTQIIGLEGTVTGINVWGRMKDIVYTKEITNIGELRDRIDASALQIRAEMNNIVIKHPVSQ